MLVLEFIKLNRRSFKHLLELIKPTGDLFFDKFISINDQFCGNDWRHPEPVFFVNEKPRKTPSFRPDPKQLIELSKEFGQEALS